MTATTASTTTTAETARTLLAAARRALLDAAVAPRPADRYVAAHLAALRAAAAVLSVRTRPRRVRSGPQGVWALLAAVAPDLAEWAEYFAALGGARSAVEAGALEVTGRAADDLLRDAETFCARIAALIGP